MEFDEEVQMYSQTSMEDVRASLDDLRKIVEIFRIMSERLANENLQTITSRYIINSIYGEVTSELANEYHALSRAIEEFPVAAHDSLVGIYKLTIETLMREHHPAEIVMLSSLFKEALSYFLQGIGFLLKMSDHIVFKKYVDGLFRGSKRKNNAALLIITPTKRKSKDEEGSSSNGS